LIGSLCHSQGESFHPFGLPTYGETRHVTLRFVFGFIQPVPIEIAVGVGGEYARGEQLTSDQLSFEGTDGGSYGTGSIGGEVQETRSIVAHNQGIVSTRTPPIIFSGNTQRKRADGVAEGRLSGKYALIAFITESFRHINGIEQTIVGIPVGIGVFSGEGFEGWVGSVNDLRHELQRPFTGLQQEASTSHCLESIRRYHGCVVPAKGVVGVIGNGNRCRE